MNLVPPTFSLTHSFLGGVAGAGAWLSFSAAFVEAAIPALTVTVTVAGRQRTGRAGAAERDTGRAAALCTVPALSSMPQVPARLAPHLSNLITALH